MEEPNTAEKRARDTYTYTFCSWHESLIVEPWPALAGGIRVAHVDDPDQPILLLRDASEVKRLVQALDHALTKSEAAVV